MVAAASPVVGTCPRRQLRGALAPARLGGPTRRAPGLRRPVRRLRHTRRPAGAGLLSPSEARAYDAGAGGCSTLAGLPGDDPLDRAPTPARRRLRVRHGRAARAPARRDHPRHPPAHGVHATPPAGTMPAPTARPKARRRRPVGRPSRSWSRGRVVLGTDLDPWAYDNERPPTRSTWPVPARRHPVTNEAYPGLPRRRWLRRPALVGAGGLVGGRRRAWSPPVLARRRRLDRPALRRAPAAGAARARPARVLVRGRRLRPLGRLAPAH